MIRRAILSKKSEYKLLLSVFKKIIIIKEIACRCLILKVLVNFLFAEGKGDIISHFIKNGKQCLVVS